MAQQLVAKGYAGAKAIIGDGKMRVSIQSCATEKEAYRALNLNSARMKHTRVPGF